MTRLVLLAPALLFCAAASADSITFARRQPASGDAIDHAIRVEMRVETTARRGAEVLEQDASSVDRTQTRRVTATAVESGRVVGADVRFFDSTATRDGEATAEPVAGKSYHCRLEGDELRITTPDGALPPMEEYALVARAMESLGKPSPLAQFLAGRTVTVGERLELPANLARQALGFDEQVGDVERFTLKLQAVETIESRRVARFDAEIEAVGASGQQMRLIVTGEFRVDGETCRIVSTDLSGPIALSGLVGPSTVGYTLDGKGKMRLALKARYYDAGR